jgi:tRNA A37 N6-isopentenylltransferase MiaA
MERYEEKIIDLVDVVGGPEWEQTEKKSSPKDLAQKIEETVERKQSETGSLFKEEVEKASVFDQKPETPEPAVSSDLEILIRNEVERVLRSSIGDNIQKMIRDILTQEVEKAIAREIEILKNPN